MRARFDFSHLAEVLVVLSAPPDPSSPGAARPPPSLREAPEFRWDERFRAALALAGWAGSASRRGILTAVVPTRIVPGLSPGPRRGAAGGGPAALSARVGAGDRYWPSRWATWPTCRQGTPTGCCAPWLAALLLARRLVAADGASGSLLTRLVAGFFAASTTSGWRARRS